MKSKKIVICSSFFPPNGIGGAEIIAFNQAKTLQEKGHNVLVFSGDTDQSGGRWYVKSETFEGLPVFRIALTPTDYSLEQLNFINLRVVEYFNIVLDNFSPDIVHFHNIIGLSVSLIWEVHKRNIKTILTIHDHWGFCMKNTLIDFDNKICSDSTRCSRCFFTIKDEDNFHYPVKLRKDFIELQFDFLSKVISPSKYLVNKYIKTGVVESDRIVNIWNGVDVEYFQNNKNIRYSQKVRFTFIGYLGEHKGVDVLLDAIKYLDGDNYIINIVGDGHLKKEIQNKIINQKLNDRVKMWGKIDNRKIINVFNQTDVFILPSIWPENQPVTITEAMAFGIPSIVTDKGGNNELVEDCETGYLFELSNSKMLAEKIMKFINNPKLISTMGKKAFNKIRENTFNNQIENIERVYEDSKCENKRLEDKFIVVCEGKSYSIQMQMYINSFMNRKVSRQRIKFIQLDWIDELLMKKCDVALVVGDIIQPEDFYKLVKNKLPIIFPESNLILNELCVKGNCGLRYSIIEELEYIFEYLMNHPKEYLMLQNNCQRLLANIAIGKRSIIN